MHQDLNAAFSLAGRVAVGTGAAGIGRETAHVPGGIAILVDYYIVMIMRRSIGRSPSI